MYDVAAVKAGLADGTLDTSFGTGGIVTTAVGGGEDIAWDITLQDDGKIVLVGQANTGPTNDIALVRYNADGTLATLGRAKSEVMAERIADINPELVVRACRDWITPTSLPALFALGPYDYVADCIDGVAGKVALIAACLARDIPIIASMGAAGRLDPAQVRLTTLNQTHGDGLARAVRRGLRARGLRPELRVVFSDEPVRPATRDVDAGRAAHGVIGYLPALFGVMLGGEIVRCLLAGEVR